MKKLKKIILSRGRWDTITTHKFLKDFYILVPDDELEKYKNSLQIDNFLTIPSEIIGLANYLGVSIQCVRQYPKKKRYLMLLGIKYLNELRTKNG